MHTILATHNFHACKTACTTAQHAKREDIEGAIHTPIATHIPCLQGCTHRCAVCQSRGGGGGIHGCQPRIPLCRGPPQAPVTLVARHGILGLLI
eukprot:700797-Pelagomonas_calceolata.AAC.1